jgi:hypothetical protein
MLEIIMLEQCFYILHYLGSFDINHIYIFKKKILKIQIIKNCRKKYEHSRIIYLLKRRFQK